MDISGRLEILKKHIEKENFRGYDPYDALNSPILRALTAQRKILRIFFIQTLKRLPFNLRHVLNIRKGFNPKGIGLFLWGYAKLYKIEKKQEYFDRIIFFLELLKNLRSKGYSGYCWGFNFDWQSRAFYLPKFTPTVVNSAFIGHALIDTYMYTNLEKALEMAISIKDFILEDINKRHKGTNICLSYSPFDRTAIHNANMLGASLLIRIYKYVKESPLKDMALASLDYSMKFQRDDGSWYYAETDFQKWIDSFHTGFNLQSLLYFLKEGFGTEYRKDFKKGVKYYSENFFLADGTPKYYHNKLYPIDIHSAAQALVIFSRLGRQYQELQDKLVRWMTDHMQDQRGYFYFQKNKVIRNKIPYIRWSQAWAFHAMTEYIINNES